MHRLGLTNRKVGIIQRKHWFQFSHLNNTHVIILQKNFDQFLASFQVTETNKKSIIWCHQKSIPFGRGQLKLNSKLNLATALRLTYDPLVLLQCIALATSWWPPRTLENLCWGAEPRQWWTGMALASGQPGMGQWVHLPAPALTEISKFREGCG